MALRAPRRLRPRAGNGRSSLAARARREGQAALRGRGDRRPRERAAARRAGPDRAVGSGRSAAALRPLARGARVRLLSRGAALALGRLRAGDDPAVPGPRSAARRPGRRCDSGRRRLGLGRPRPLRDGGADVRAARVRERALRGPLRAGARASDRASLVRRRAGSRAPARCPSLRRDRRRGRGRRRARGLEGASAQGRAARSRRRIAARPVRRRRSAPRRPLHRGRRRRGVARGPRRCLVPARSGTRVVRGWGRLDVRGLPGARNRRHRHPASDAHGVRSLRAPHSCRAAPPVHAAPDRERDGAFPSAPRLRPSALGGGDRGRGRCDHAQLPPGVRRRGSRRDRVARRALAAGRRARSARVAQRRPGGRAGRDRDRGRRAARAARRLPPGERRRRRPPVPVLVGLPRGPARDRRGDRAAVLADDAARERGCTHAGAGRRARRRDPRRRRRGRSRAAPGGAGRRLRRAALPGVDAGPGRGPVPWRRRLRSRRTPPCSPHRSTP